jgi:polysaccharide export outer membrane protein
MSPTTCSLLCFSFGFLAPALAAQPPPPEAPSSYVLGPDDQIAIRALDVEEISEKPIRIDLRGNLNLPLVGRLRAAGLTAEQLEADLVARLKTYVREPQVTVIITEFRSQPVSVLGAVTNPGVHQIQGRKSLFEILSMAGGLRQDAGNTIKITRRKEWGPIPLPNAKDDPSGQFSVAEVSIRSVMEAKNPQENILVRPYDVISVPKAELVYVIGEVARSGGFTLNEQGAISALQALSLAGGLARTAAPQRAKILRMNHGAAQRTEVALNLKQILAGKAGDVLLQPDDILFVPNNTAKNVAIRTIEAVISVGSGLAIYRGGIAR